ncbi:uncharacterized protein LOC142330715 [Lycorma delicatula]|uniref:uncharacterized protein LOC142330715 n=1 Tax=Lycorma delicatula TaxID=130591 RepID=UPI003F50DEF0
MDEMDRISTDEFYKRERDRQMVQEGLYLCEQRKHERLMEKKREQQEAKFMLANYNPWGRPGGGAPNEMNVRRRKTNILYPDRIQPAGRQIQLYRSKKPRQSFKRRADPFLRFQFLPPVRKSVDINIRYHKTPAEKFTYKQELDHLVACKRQIQRDMMRKSTSLEQKLLAGEAPWGKPGPGGSTWRDPRTIGLNFLHSLGWTGEPAFRRLEQEHYAQEQQYRTPRQPQDYPILEEGPQMNNRKEIHPPEELLTGGVELVPLLARRRSLPRRCTLRTTDVTNNKRQEQQIQPPETRIWKETTNDKEYLMELTNQVQHKQMKIKEDRNEDLVKSRRHFETWGKFWGRPGHGAPRGRNTKENLEYLLYQVPVK